MITEFTIFGGDMRQLFLARLISEAGHAVSISALGLASGTEDFPAAAPPYRGCVLLPFPALNASGMINAPFSTESITPESVFAAVAPGTPVLAGRISPRLAAAAEDSAVLLADYAKSEAFEIKNAIPSAEGAILHAISMSTVTLFGSSCLVAGYGRIGKVLSRSLAALGARVSVSARRDSDFAWISAGGMIPLRTDALSGKLGGFDFIFNTVPAPVFTAELLSGLKRGCVLIDLASTPGGTDFAAAETLNLKYVHALGLPGKYSPESAAAAIWDSVRFLLGTG